MYGGEAGVVSNGFGNQLLGPVIVIESRGALVTPSPVVGAVAVYGGVALFENWESHIEGLVKTGCDTQSSRNVRRSDL